MEKFIVNQSSVPVCISETIITELAAPSRNSAVVVPSMSYNSDQVVCVVGGLKLMMNTIVGCRCSDKRIRPHKYNSLFLRPTHMAKLSPAWLNYLPHGC